MALKLLLRCLMLTLTCKVIYSGTLVDIFLDILENAPGPTSDDAPASDDDNPIDSSLFREAQGNSNCARVSGCKAIEAQLCTGPSGTNQCPHCFHTIAVNPRNIMRADFYESVTSARLQNMKDCTRNNNCPFPLASEFAKYMLLSDDRIALSAQGAPYRSYQVPPGLLIENTKKYCDVACVKKLKTHCENVPYIKHLRSWCNEILEWVQDSLPDLAGPGSYVAHLAKLAAESPRASYEEKAALVAAAAASIFLTGHWWSEIEQAPHTDMRDFGFAVQHSLFLAIYDGRLRVTVQQIDSSDSQFVPGKDSACSQQEEVARAENFAGSSGNVYATICAAFKPGRPTKSLRYRPEIHERSNEGCVERKAGMVFVLPGDWITKSFNSYRIGRENSPKGLAFSPIPGELTNIELYPSGVAKLFPPAIAMTVSGHDETSCTDAKGNGDSLSGKLGIVNLKGFGGICNWIPSW